MPIAEARAGGKPQPEYFRQDGQQRDSALLSLESKRQTLLSRSVLLRVVEALNLQRDPEFVPPTSWTSLLSPRALLGGGGAAQSPEIVALDNLMRRVDARRDELSRLWSQRHPSCTVDKLLAGLLPIVSEATRGVLDELYPGTLPKAARGLDAASEPQHREEREER